MLRRSASESHEAFIPARHPQGSGEEIEAYFGGSHQLRPSSDARSFQVSPSPQVCICPPYSTECYFQIRGHFVLVKLVEPFSNVVAHDVYPKIPAPVQGWQVMADEEEAKYAPSHSPPLLSLLEEKQLYTELSGDYSYVSAGQCPLALLTSNAEYLNCVSLGDSACIALTKL